MKTKALYAAVLIVILLALVRIGASAYTYVVWKSAHRLVPSETPSKNLPGTLPPYEQTPVCYNCPQIIKI
jgi:hypothetical protein